MHPGLYKSVKDRQKVEVQGFAESLQQGSSKPSEIVMIELCIAVVQAYSGYYFFQVRKGLGSSQSYVAKILQSPVLNIDASLSPWPIVVVLNSRVSHAIMNNEPPSCKILKMMTINCELVCLALAS